MLLIAIDPGANGGIAIQAQGYTSPPVVVKMPETPKDIHELLGGILSSGGLNHGGACAIVEKVGMHRQGNNASASCKFARHCGHIEMALIALGIPFEEVTPQKWMKSMGVMPKEKQARKNHIKDIVQRRFPTIKCTLWNSDALGIMLHQLERTK